MQEPVQPSPLQTAEQWYDSSPAPCCQMAMMFVGTNTPRCCYWERMSQWWCWVEPAWWCRHGQYQRSIILVWVCICISFPTSMCTVRQGTFGGKRGRMKTDEAFCSFQKSVLLCAVGPSRPPTWDWGHLSAEIGASRWHFIWKYSQSCSELTRALGEMVTDRYTSWITHIRNRKLKAN